MKIQCDVCNTDEATVFCSADEASLCPSCDHRVHLANKLAGKHHRFSLLHPSPSQFPLCDICQEKRAFLFCQQDRAILCGDCDIPIHKANEHTRNHNRFLLTGVKLSAVHSPSSPVASGCDLVPNFKPRSSIDQPVSSSALSAISDQSKAVDKTPAADQSIGGAHPASSVPEYLTEVLPDWQFEDFLDSSSFPFGFCKIGDENVISQFWDTKSESNLASLSSTSSTTSENMGIWVPQAPPPLPPPPPLPQQQIILQLPCTSATNGHGGQTGVKETMNMKSSSKKWRDDGNCTVPQISPLSKRSRTLW